MQKVDAWNPKMFTLTHTPVKYRAFVSKFIRRVLIARMAEAPDLASMYHVKLREAYETEDKVKDPDIMRQSEEELIKLLMMLKRSSARPNTSLAMTSHLLIRCSSLFLRV